MKEMRKMAPKVNATALKFVNYVGRNLVGKEVGLEKVVGQFVMDCIGKILFGIELDTCDNPNNGKCRSIVHCLLIDVIV